MQGVDFVFDCFGFGGLEVWSLGSIAASASSYSASCFRGPIGHEVRP